MCRPPATGFTQSSVVASGRAQNDAYGEKRTVNDWAAELGDTTKQLFCEYVKQLKSVSTSVNNAITVTETEKVASLVQTV